MKGKLLCANDAMLDPLRGQDAERLGVKPGRDMRPVVEAGCVCMGYERRLCPRPQPAPPCPPPRPPRPPYPPFPPHPHPDPDEKIAALIENVLSGKMGDITDAVSGQITPQISSIAGDAASQTIDGRMDYIIDSATGAIIPQVDDIANATIDGRMGEITDNVISAVGDDMVSAVTQNVSADVQQRIDEASISVINVISTDIQSQLDDMVITGNDDIDDSEVYYGGGA